MQAPSALQATAGLRLAFPSGRVLVIGSPAAGAAPLELRRSGSAWRLSAARPPLGAAPKELAQAVFVQPRPGPVDLRSHAVLDGELMVVEAAAGQGPGLRWEGAEDRAVPPAVAGAFWLTEGRARLVIGVLPRNFLDDTGAGNRSAAGVDAEAIDAAVGALREMVRALIDDRRPVAGEAEAAPGLATAVDPTAVLDAGRAVQRLHRLLSLLREGGVLDAWEALLADPPVLLTAEHPVRPMGRARRPILAGPRGPWSLAEGWSPDRPLGLVRDRQVRRTADTPPNRLAVQLAARVRAELDLLQRALGKGSAPHAYSALIDDLRQRATAIERAPAFAEVDRAAPLALDSPSLQANRRCQPLLRAWHRIGREVRYTNDIPLDEVVLEPLAKAHHLYELWCAHRLRALLTAQLGSPAEDGADGWTRATWRQGDGGRLVLAASLDPGPLDEDDAMKGDPRKATGWSQAVRSWGLVCLPDGYLAVRARPGEAWHVLIWDAKYRRVTFNRYLSGITYQAHAFRDAVRVVLDGQAIPALWSVVLHPTRAQGAAVPERFLLAEVPVDAEHPCGPVCGDADGTWDLGGLADAMREGRGGVGILGARPDDGGPRKGEPLAELVDHLLQLLNPSPPVRA
ncbi:MAG: hypothetical protein JNM72_06020 [Deltaproteobacteria bacterium]|nr:hypothetical protein [Deltaproteobacteria bacterium]